jgi:hypothetical protein
VTPPDPSRLSPRRDEDVPERCCVPGCGSPSARSLARVEARKVYTDLSEQGRRAPLCREHYKRWKKETKDARRLDRLGR